MATNLTPELEQHYLMCLPWALLSMDFWRFMTLATGLAPFDPKWYFND